MKKTDIAEKVFNEGYNCSQAVIIAYSEHSGLNDETAFRIASGFGGGMGRMQETCGAVTGAFMVIGLESWDKKEIPDRAKEPVYGFLNEFVRQFTERNSTISCRELLNCDLKSAEGKLYFKNKSLREKVCLKCIKDSVEILGSMFHLNV